MLKFKDHTDVVTIPVGKIPSNNQEKKKIPPDVKGQLDVVFKNAEQELQYMPFWLKLFGANRLKNEALILFKNQKFRNEVADIFLEAKKQPMNKNKDIAEILRNRNVYDSVLECISVNVPDGSLVKFVAGIDFVRDNYFQMVKKGSHECLLYGND